MAKKPVAKAAAKPAAKAPCKTACKAPAKPAAKPVAKKIDTTTKAGLLEAIADAAKITKKQAADAYAAFLAAAYKNAKAKEGYMVPGLGKLIMGERKARKGRNPLTGAEIKIPKAKILKFRVAKAAKDAVIGKK